jgi:hypothetical protein
MELLPEVARQARAPAKREITDRVDPCAGKSDSTVELLELDKSGIHVAAYFTELPSPELLRRKLRQAIALAKARLEGRLLPEKS